MTFYNNNFVTTTSRVTADQRYPYWYLPPDYRVEFDPNSGTDQDLMIENKDFCFFATTERYMTWGQLPTSDEDDGSLEILGLATLDYLGNEDVFVYMARFKWEGSFEYNLSWLRDVYQFSRAIENSNSQAIVDNKMAYAFNYAKIEQVWAFDDNNTNDNFTISNQNSLKGTFAFCNVFNQELGWDTSNVTDMSYMFHNASVFNKPANFNTANVTNMESMFRSATAFNQPLNFDTSNVTDMSSMFSGATVFNQDVNFNTVKVTNMFGMFKNATTFNSSVNFTDTSNVTIMEGMFALASVFNQPLDNFDTSNVTNMDGMFYYAGSFDQTLNFDTSNVVDMASMFSNATAFNQDISGWCVSQIRSKPYNFDTGSGFENQSWDQPRWGVGCALGDAGKNYFVSSVNTLTASDLPAFGQTVSDLTYLGSTNGGYLYSATFSWNNDSGPLTPPRLDWLVDVRQFGNNKLGNGSLAFYYMPAAQLTALPDLDTSNLTNMWAMFSYARSFNQPLDNFDTSNVTRMEYMFNQTNVFNQPLNHFDTSNVTSMRSMFARALAFNQPLNFDTSNVINMAYMFYDASVFNQNISSWCVENILNKPTDFDTNSGFVGQTAKQPQWGQPC